MQHLYQTMDKYPAIPIGMVLVLVIMVVIRRRRGSKKAPLMPSGGRRDIASGGPLDQPLFWWTNNGDPFRVRDLLNGGLLILGRAGSGKTSSSGRTVMQNIVNNPQSAGLIVAAKPEDVGDVQRIFSQAGRLNDLILFDDKHGWRCNFSGCLTRTRDVVQFFITMSEAMKRGDGKGGGENSRFYDAQEQRTLENAVAALQAAGEALTAANVHKFIMTAARTPEELNSPEWRQSYHCQVLERGFNTAKTPLEEPDFQLCLDFWLREWAGLMDSKTRGNILAGVQATLHTMNTGIVREMVSGRTNCSPADVLAGKKWILVNFPPSAWGQAGLLISAGWKQLMELAILERTATDASPFVTIWCDEAHQFVTNFDSSFIAQCRSHKGCLVYLTQSVSSFYAAMKGDTGRHQSDALLANFSHVIVHASDPVTAKWASSKLGRRKEILYSGSSSSAPDVTVWDQMYGNNHASSSFSEHYEQVLQDQEFMIGRTGGPSNNFIADAIVLKSGEPFSDGRQFQRVAFSQRG